jgi:flagellar motility protein MotE (MotC chaperone)
MTPRILPLIGVAVGGVLAVNAMAGARQLPDLLTGAKAFAEVRAKPEKAPAQDKKGEAAATGEAADASALAMPPLAPTAKPKPVCAPTAAELAKEAGLSPAELQVLQSLGERRGQLDQRENDLNTQLALLAAAEAKLDANVKALNGLKADIDGMLHEADQKQASETDRLVKVFESMKPRDAGPRMMLLDDSVRLPIVAKMKERSLSAVLSQMPPAEAKKLTESLAARYSAAKAMAANAQAVANQAAGKVTPPATGANAGPAVTAEAPGVGPTPAPSPKTPPAKRRPAPQRKAAAPHKAAAPEAQAAAAPPAEKAPAPPAAPATPKAG